MARWSDRSDVLADLDELSLFSAGSTYTQDIPFDTYSSYGRGTFIQEREPSPPSSPLLTLDEDISWIAPRRYEPGIGRGDRIRALTRHRQDEASLQRQLRMAMGAGFSNELIENFINGDSSSESGQFEDIDNFCETPSNESATTIQSLPSNESPTTTQSLPSNESPITTESSTTTESSSPSFSEPQDAIESPVKEVKKKPPPKNRNALLNSLLKNKENKIDNGVSIVEKNLVPEEKEKRTTLLYVPPPMRVKISETPPKQIQSSRNTSLYVPPPMRVKVSENKAKTELENVILKNFDEGSRRNGIIKQASYPSDLSVVLKKTEFGFNFNVGDFPPL